MKTLRELFLEPETAAVFPPGRLARMEEALQAGQRDDTPWYLRVVIGFGAWLASLFFLGSACALFDWNHPHRATIGAMGVVLLIAAVLVGRQKWGLFAEQVALAASLAAQGMIYIGVLPDSPGGHPLRTAMFLALALAAVLYLVFPGFLSRLVTCFAALQLTLLWIQVGDIEVFSAPMRSPETLALLALGWWTVHLAGIIWALVLPRRTVDLAPLGYALIASLAAWQMEDLFSAWNTVSVLHARPNPILWLAHDLRVAILGLTLLGIAVWAAGGRAALRGHPGPFLGLAAGVAALIGLGLGGVLLALLFVLLGFALQDRPVLGLGLLLFPVVLSHYYYSLELDLLQKSGVLVASGVVVLVLRAGVLRWGFDAVRGKETA